MRSLVVRRFTTTRTGDFCVRDRVDERRLASMQSWPSPAALSEVAARASSDYTSTRRRDCYFLVRDALSAQFWPFWRVAI